MNGTDWKSQIESELHRAQMALEEGSDGKARACSRRAVGILLKEMDDAKSQNARPRSAVDRLRETADDESLPENIRGAAQRLTTNVRRRLSRDFTFHPVRDAQILIDYFSKTGL
jgi:hypothetical protein